MCRLLGVNSEHLPDLVGNDQPAGNLCNEAAEKRGLASGIPVFGGGGDANLIGLGAGAVHVGDTHIYMGTSGWISTLIQK